MTAVPTPPTGRILTAAEFLALPEDNEFRYELQEGILVVSPRPVPAHQVCMWRLGTQLENSIPRHFQIAPEVEINLELVTAGQLETIRVPDLAVVSVDGLERVHRHGGSLRPADVALVVEVFSPSSRRLDSVMKHSDYADAGIGHYWMIDLDDGPSLIACHLAGEFGYVDAPPVRGVFETSTPFPARIDLSALFGYR